VALHRFEASEKYASCEQQIQIRLFAIDSLHKMLDALIALFEREATFSRIAGVLVIRSEQQSFMESADRGNGMLDGRRLEPDFKLHLLPERRVKVSRKLRCAVMDEELQRTMYLAILATGDGSWFGM
jgi:hypothetical protein